MKTIIISQVFWPDTVSVAQQLWDFTLHLAESGHEVLVFSSQYSYEQNPKKRYQGLEKKLGIEIVRLKHTNFSKKFIIGRVLNMATFNAMIFFKLIGLKKGECSLIFGTTSPPLLSYFGLVIARFKKIPYCCWIMDLQPELAIQSGLIKGNSYVAAILLSMSRFVLEKSDLIIALDRFMMSYIRQFRSSKICISPVWSVAYERYDGSFQSNPFRIQNKMGEKIVVMYSGNHAYIHPLDTLLNTALKLKDNDDFLFVFVGGGVRKSDVEIFKSNHELDNIMQIDFQPRGNIHNSLSAANIHVVIIGDGQVGFTHPSKIYGALDIGRPILYIGPKPSHVDDILSELPGNISVLHGQVNILVDKLLEFSNKKFEEVNEICKRNHLYGIKKFNPSISKRTMHDAIHSILSN